MARSGRAMILYGYDIDGLTISDNVFNGTTSTTTTYNDGIKIDSLGNFGVRGNVTITNNTFKDFHQYVNWFRKYSAGTYVINNNYYENIGTNTTEGAYHGSVAFITRVASDTNDVVNVQMNRNTFVNVKGTIRIDSSSISTAENFNVVLNYNCVTSVTTGVTIYAVNSTTVRINCKNNYWGVATVTDAMFTGAENIDYTEFYAAASEIPAEVK